MPDAQAPLRLGTNPFPCWTAYALVVEGPSNRLLFPFARIKPHVRDAYELKHSLTLYFRSGHKFSIEVT